jgi:ABC-2 type transport system permease protein
MRLVLFVMPVVQMTVFGLALTTEVRGIRLAAFRAPGDRAMERTVERFLASKWFVPAETGGDDPFGAIQSGRADACLVAPREGLSRGREGLQLLIDATNASKARAVESYARAILARGPPAGGVSLDVRVLYNPSMESSVFMVPGVMSMILCLITIILTSMSLAKERESGTFETIVSAPLGKREILLGKTLPYILLGLADAVLVVAAGAVLFSVPLRGPLWMLAAGSAAFVLATVSIGTCISTIAENQQQAMMGSFLFLFPAMLLSGMMFPVENMPLPLRWVAYLDPLKYFITLMRNVMLKGGDPRVFGWNVLVLLAMAASAAALGERRFRQTLN